MSGYIGTLPIPLATQQHNSIIATSGQTAFTCEPHQADFEIVWLNGVKLKSGLDYSTDGTVITLATGAALNDILEVVAFTTFNVANVATNAQGALADTAVQPADLSPGTATGIVSYFAASTAPTGYLKANGAAISRTTYADLFAIVGTTYGVGDGTTTFTLPDLRGEFLRGADDGRGVDTGRSFGSAQADELKAHTHTFSAPASSAGFGGGPYSGQQNVTTRSVSSTGGAETRPRNIALLACIKY